MFLSSQPYYFPDNAAYAIGDEDDSGFYVMQTHYNNPGHKHGKLQVHYTTVMPTKSDSDVHLCLQ